MLNNLHAQINQELVQEYFKEAKDLCIRDNGKLWGVSICGPMVIYDIASKTLATIFLVLVGSCVMESSYDNRLIIINNSNKVICFDHELDTTLEVPSVNKKEYFIRERIEPGDSTRVEISGSWTQWIREVSAAKDSTLSVFVFDYGQVITSDWDSLRSRRMYRRLDYTLEDLNKHNWRVIVK